MWSGLERRNDGLREAIPPTVQTVTSTDGTSLAYEQYGEGPPLILRHGSSGTREGWDPLRPALADEFSVYAPDRRGRGDSGDSGAYDLEHEVADLRALVETVDGRPTRSLPAAVDAFPELLGRPAKQEEHEENKEQNQHQNGEDDRVDAEDESGEHTPASTGASKEVSTVGTTAVCFTPPVAKVRVWT